MPNLIRLEYRRPGKQIAVYNEWLVLDRPDVKVLLLDEYDGVELYVDDNVVLETSAPIVWFVFPEKWHDIGRFHLADDTFTGWYTNFCKPVEMNGDHWIGSDLFLDLWQPADGEPAWLDEDELSEAIRTKLIDAQTKRRIENERALIDLQVKQEAWPPAIVRDIDLVQAREILKGG